MNHGRQSAASAFFNSLLGLPGSKLVDEMQEVDSIWFDASRGDNIGGDQGLAHRLARQSVAPQKKMAARPIPGPAAGSL